MADFVLSIRPAVGALASVGRPILTSTLVEVAFDRSAGTDEDGKTLPPIRDTVRGFLDATLSGAVSLPDAVAGATAEVRFLSASGAVNRTVSAPVSQGSGATVELTAADLTAITAPEPRPAPVPEFVRRDGKLVPVDGTDVPFKRSDFLVAAVTVGGGGWAALGLDNLFKLDTPKTTAVASAAPVWPQLEAQPWMPVPLAIDGSFTTFFKKDSTKDAWLWWLAGPLVAIGIQLDDLSAPAGGEVPVLLPPLGGFTPTEAGATAGAGTRLVPADVTEREVAQNPEIYTEDPGAFCKPFSNPERVLGERSFSVIYRAEQPVVSPEATIRTATGPLLDFELPPVASGGAPGRSSLAARVAGALGVGSAAVSPSSIVRFPALQSFVVRDALPAAVASDLQRGDRGRQLADAQHPVQWDSDASRYQAVTVSRGHILEFRMRWRSNGYSLGTVAKTLTLAPRQVKKIQKIEWQRVDRVRREERTQLLDRVSDVVSRERQYDDAVQASLSEWSSGESESSVGAAAGGFGFALAGFVIGGGGGQSNASSSSSQQGGRRTTASEEQRLRDTVRRYGDSLRRLESVVVNEVTQEETVTGTAEVVRNPNFGHALTVIYYQILRHLKVETGFAGVRECLFVPFALKPFTVARAFRWRDLLQRGLLDHQFGAALRYLKDVLTGFAGSTVPPGRRSDQRIRHISGSLFITIGVERPRDTADGNFDANTWSVLGPFLGVPPLGIFGYLKAQAEAQRDRVFQEQHAPGIAALWLNTLTMSAGSIPLQVDFTLATRYRFNATVRVDFSTSLGQTVITREMLASIKVLATKNLPPGSVANLTRMSLTYQTDQFQHTIAINQGAADLILPETGLRDVGGAVLFSLPDTWEREDIRAEMVRAVNDLLGHLNEHSEHYHKVIWWNMDRDRLFMLVDGFFAPGTNGVSIGSVIERDPIAIVGNSLVFRVSAGSFLGLGDLDDPAKLYNYYAHHQPISDPMLVSLPTDGLYAQTIMDECESLEEHYGSTDWILDDAEPDVPTIGPELLTTRRAPPENAQPTPFPQTLISLQNAAEAPAPSGLGGVLNAVTTANAFRDMAGLAGTQANALAGLQTAASLATSFGQQAAALKLAELNAKANAAREANQKLATVKRAADKDLVSSETAKMQAEKILDELHAPSAPPPHEDREIAKAIRAATATPGSQIEATTGEGQVRVMLANANPTPLKERCGFFDLAGRVLDEATVRNAVVDATRAERDSWRNAGGGLLKENEDAQFPHLVRYWLEERQQIPRANLSVIGANAIDPATNYGQLLDPAGVPAATVAAEAHRVATDLIAGVPDPAAPPDLARVVEQALLDARQSRLNATPWSAAFVNACVRLAETNVNLEGPNTLGQQALLALSRFGRHWEYTLEAHRRRFGCRRPDGSFDAQCRRDGTYQAFRTTERAVQVGDIIVQDRQASQLADVLRFDRIPNLAGRDMHGDIVVDVQPTFAETIGGNVGDSARRRRFPLDADGRLVVVQNQLFVQESDAEVFPALPANSPDPLNGSSTARIVALLSLVDECVTLPGQPVGKDAMLV